jgi:hypothetical protein
MSVVPRGAGPAKNAVSSGFGWVHRFQWGSLGREFRRRPPNSFTLNPCCESRCRESRRTPRWLITALASTAPRSIRSQRAPADRPCPACDSASWEGLKRLVREGTASLMLGTDAASEGLNLQRMGSSVSLNLSWNPTKMEQRKGRIQRIGQVNASVFVHSMRYLVSVEDRVDQLSSTRLQEIFTLFGQVPDVLERVDSRGPWRSRAGEAGHRRRS